MHWLPVSLTLILTVWSAQAQDCSLCPTPQASSFSIKERRHCCYQGEIECCAVRIPPDYNPPAVAQPDPVTGRYPGSSVYPGSGGYSGNGGSDNYGYPGSGGYLFGNGNGGNSGYPGSNAYVESGANAYAGTSGSTRPGRRPAVVRTEVQTVVRTVIGN